MTERSGQSDPYGDGGLVTDENTDMMYCMVINEDKVHPDYQSELNREKINQINRIDPIVAKPEEPNVKSYHKRKPEYRGLPSVHSSSSEPRRSRFNSDESEGGSRSAFPDDQTGVCFDDCSIQYPQSRDVLRVNQPIRTDYVFKANRSVRRPHGRQRTDLPSSQPGNPIRGGFSGQAGGRFSGQDIAAGAAAFAPALGKTLLGGTAEELRKTPTEIRRQARDYYCQLMEMKTKYKVLLTKEYTMDDDPEEMKAELDLHREARNRNARLKMSKDVLSFSVCVAEFLNAEYNPFKLKLDNWSNQVGADLDDNAYDDVLQELCDKYTAKGTGMFGGWSPEVKLLAMMGGGAMMYHFSNLKSGPTLKDEIKRDPDTAARIIKEMMVTKQESEVPDKQTQSSIDMIRRRREELAAARMQQSQQMPTLKEIASTRLPYRYPDRSERQSERPMDHRSSRPTYPIPSSNPRGPSLPRGSASGLAPQLRVFDDAQREVNQGLSLKQARGGSPEQARPRQSLTQGIGSRTNTSPLLSQQTTLAFAPESEQLSLDERSGVSLIRDEFSELIESLQGTSDDEASSSEEVNLDHSSSSDLGFEDAFPSLASEQTPKASPIRSGRNRPILSAKKPSITSTRRRAMLLR